MDKTTITRVHKAYASNAFNKGYASLTIGEGASITSTAIDAQSAGVPKAIKFPDGWTPADICFLVSQEDLDVPPAGTLEDIMEYVREENGTLITMTPVAGQTQLVPEKARQFMSAFNFFAIVSGTDVAKVNQVSVREITVFLAANLT